MPYDTLAWGEEVQNTTLLGVNAKGPTGYGATGDTLTVLKGLGTPVLFGIGGCSDTKPNASGITPQFSHDQTTIYGPAAINFSGEGYQDLREYGGIKLMPGETLSGLGCNTNVSEGIVTIGQLSYGGFPAITAATPNYSKVTTQLMTITSAAAVTWLSGAVSLTTGLTSDTFLDLAKKYHLLGIVPNVSAATLGGILSFSGLSGNWHGFYPGGPLNPLSAVTFNAGNGYRFPQPIPVAGDEFGTVQAGVCATTAGAISFGLVIGEL